VLERRDKALPVIGDESPSVDGTQRDHNIA